MKRFIVAAALAVALSVSYSNAASAQIVYGYSVPNAGGVANGRTVIVPGATKTFNSYYSPFTGVTVGQSMYTDVFGQAYTRNFGYNAFTGMGFRNSFYQPNYYVSPFGYGVSNVYGRRMGW